MTYLPRDSEALLTEYARHFKVLLLVGARQVGKSTILGQCFPSHRQIVFDPVLDSHGARSDPELFLQSNPPPLILDEIQFVPELLSCIKRRLDSSEERGQYLLTGSQNLALVRSVAESMAGRVAIFELGGMSLAELRGAGGLHPSILEAWLGSGGRELIPQAPVVDPLPLMDRLWRGSFPGVIGLPDSLVPAFHDSYLKTYVERDLRSLAALRDLGDFGRFVRLAAALSGQEINLSQLGREIGVRPATARNWLDLLAAGYLWQDLGAWSGNTIKRVSGKPKGHLCDSGLACRLLGISSPQVLSGHPALGAIFESFAVHQVRRRLSALGPLPAMHHWRSAGGAEVDLVIERDGLLFPVEMKVKAEPEPRDARGLLAFRDSYPGRVASSGLILHPGSGLRRLNDFAWALGISAI